MDARDDINKSLGQIVQWQKDHERHDDMRFKEASEAISKLPTKDDVQEAVRQGLYEFFRSSGTIGYRTILVLASIIVALGVITGGFKWFIGLLGFTQIK